MPRVALLATVALGLALAGCGGTGLYSNVTFRTQPMPAQSLDALVRANGAPDIQGRVGDLTLVGWRGAEGLSVWDRVLTMLPLFAQGRKPSYVALVDPQGQVVTASRGRPGRFISVLGVFPAPLMAAETNH